MLNRIDHSIVEIVEIVEIAEICFFYEKILANKDMRSYSNSLILL